jgi:NADPH:quinone reductase
MRPTVACAPARCQGRIGSAAVRGAQVTSLQGPAAVVLAELPEPTEPSHPQTPGSGVLVEVHAAGVSFPDLLLSRGQYQLKVEPPFVPGVEVAGVVRAATPDTGLQPGDRVAAYTGLGGLQEVAVAPGFATFGLSERLSFAQGAALVMNYHTVWFALAMRARLAEGETVLVHGAAGGVGTAALQVAAGLGARAIAVVSSDEKERVAREAGAGEVVRADGAWRDEAKALTGGEGVDVVLDPVGGDRFLDSLRALRTGGRLVVVGFAAGGIPELRVNRLLLNNIAVVGAAWGAYIATRPEAEREIGAAVNRLVDEGHVAPIVGAEFPLERAADALALLEGRGAVGKVVVTVRD